MAKQKATTTRWTVTPLPVKIATAIALLGGLYFLRGYIGVILFSALISFVFYPIYKWLFKKTKRNSIAMIGTFISMIAAVIIPVAFVVTLGVTQVSSIVNDIQTNGVVFGDFDVDQLVDRGTERVNAIVNALPGGDGVSISREDIQNGFNELVTNSLQVFVSVLKDISFGFFGFITTSIIAIFLIAAMLRYPKEIFDFIKQLSPFHHDVMELYLNRAAAMTKAMVRGQFIIASLQGLASALSLWLVGVDYFWFFLVFLSFLSFIPLGAGIVTIPIGVVLILTGNIWQGLFIILFHMFGVSSIDNILRPFLVPADARLNTALMLLAVFAGMAMFGAAGVVFGPVIMILIVTTLELYAKYNSMQHQKALPKNVADFVD